MRLSYLMQAQKISLPNAACCSMDPNGFNSTLQEIRNSLPNSPTLVLDNVAEYYAMHPSNDWKMEDFPNIAPPWSRFFVEWKHPQQWLINGEIQDSGASSSTQYGLYVLSLKLREERLSDTEGMNRFWKSMIFGPQNLDRVTDAEKIISFPDSWADAGWIFMMPQFVDHNTGPYWIGMIHHMVVSKRGQWITGCSFGPTVDHLRSMDSNFSGTPQHILSLGLSFCHCKNVVKTEDTNGRGAKWHRRMKIPVVKFYTLNIDPMRTILRRDGHSESTGLRKALHICRGHFATYTEDHPLFGKYVGTFWKPEHVRGTLDNGVVVKDYKIVK